MSKVEAIIEKQLNEMTVTVSIDAGKLISSLKSAKTLQQVANVVKTHFKSFDPKTADVFMDSYMAAFDKDKEGK